MNLRKWEGKMSPRGILTICMIFGVLAFLFLAHRLLDQSFARRRKKKEAKRQRAAKEAKEAERQQNIRNAKMGMIRKLWEDKIPSYIWLVHVFEENLDLATQRQLEAAVKKEAMSKLFPDGGPKSLDLLQAFIKRDQNGKHCFIVRAHDYTQILLDPELAELQFLTWYVGVNHKICAGDFNIEFPIPNRPKF